MAATSPSIVDRLNHVARSGSKMPLISPTSQSSPEYELEYLQPGSDNSSRRADKHASADVSERTRFRSPITLAHKSPASRRDNSAGSSYKRGPRFMFSGPPPPISSSMMIAPQPSNLPSLKHEQNRDSYEIRQTTRTNIGRTIFEQRAHESIMYNQQPDTAWRGIRRRESALEVDIQQLLDSQVEGLVAGSKTQDVTFTTKDLDCYSDTGSSTPTGTFYSTATSKSQMPRSLYIPPVSTLEGNIVPVRQPAQRRLSGLKSARNGLSRAILSLIQLRMEESDQIDTAMAERQSALAQLSKLATRRLGIQSELAAFDGDEEEPLGKQLRELSARYGSVNQEISMLEQRLVKLRNQRRSLKDKIDDANGKREAGLSGYRGALKDVDSELTILVRRPPVLPLDPGVFDKDDGDLCDEIALTGGLEYLRLNPERRTEEMAKSWWEAELAILQKRKKQVGEDHQALEEGAALWNDVVSLVSDFESGLRRLLKEGGTSKPTVKGKEKVPTRDDLMQAQLKDMSGVLKELEQAMRQAEIHGWNLLICAIGAELEAFREAQDILISMLASQGLGGELATRSEVSIGEEPDVMDRRDDVPEGGNGDASADLIRPCSNQLDQSGTPIIQEDSLKSLHTDGDGDHSRSQDSENEVPLEFLAEHD
ncbi:autophagy-related protein 28 [Pochonia chlamydosporia 170]|uniref:Autophagy-related protein 28 n=1 Tax=Pochonia chlamydosporia 170 TaxID=1380566 RepID=A0A179FDJ2_METCM|nr:autophagy-related protein 28 [Pochonia chlamydosporia 170]OAQ63574.1 autophagy-related protein 28 [Pochonia chlamydosporia 170]